MLALPETKMNDEIALRPSVTKTLVKGAIAIAVFSIFLNVTPSKLLNFTIFIVISLLIVLAYASLKRTNEYVLTNEGIIIRSFLRTEKVISYSEITDLSISQGVLAKRFDCGTIFIETRNKPAPYAVLGGGMAEVLKDVKHPSEVFEIISSRL